MLEYEVCVSCDGIGREDCITGGTVECISCAGSGVLRVPPNSKKVVDTSEYDAKDDDKRFVLGEN